MATDRSKGEVWVFAEQEEGKLSDVPRELLGKGRELADRLGVPLAGAWQEILSSDDTRFGGSGKTNPRRLHTKKIPSHGRDVSLVLTVPPLGGTLIKYTGETTHARKRRV